MGNKLTILRDNGDIKELSWYCPGCECSHSVPATTDATKERSAPPVWGWNGSLENPVIWPSVLIYGDWNKETQKFDSTRCHCFVGGSGRNKPGIIEFCGDSPHRFSGKDFPMENEEG